MRLSIGGLGSRIGCGNDGMNLIASEIVSMPLSKTVLTCMHRAITLVLQQKKSVVAALQAVTGNAPPVDPQSGV